MNVMKSRCARALLIIPMVALAATVPVSVQAVTESAWQPKVTDNLVKMDIKAIDRELARQFSGSRLALEQAEIGQKIRRQSDAVKGLQEAIDKGAQENVLRELKLREIDERAMLIASLQRRTDLRVQKAQVDLDVYSKIWKKLKRSNGRLTTEDRNFLAEQEEVMKRMQKVSASMPSLSIQPSYSDSRYNREYSLIAYDLARMQEVIDRHEANTEKLSSTVPLTKSEYATQKIIAAQSELALAFEEKRLTGLMARKLGLDATALRDDMEPSNEEGENDLLPAGHADNVVDLFLN